MLSADFKKFGILRGYLAIDELIVKFYGHNNLREFIYGKPENIGLNYGLFVV
jgi:hypothetical protein